MPGTEILLSNLSQNFNGLQIFQNLNIHIKSGEFVSILGPSGCGKSSLLRIIAGFDKAQTGSVQLLNSSQDVEKAFVFQESQLLNWRTVLENVSLPLELKSQLTPAEIKEKSIEALKLVGLENSLHKFPLELSGGMKMRVSVARAWVTQPNLLLLDEPFSALDEPNRFKLQEELLKLWESVHTSIVFVTHSISEACFLSQRILFLNTSQNKPLFEKDLDFKYPRSPNFRTSRELNEKIEEFSSLMASESML